MAAVLRPIRSLMIIIVLFVNALIVGTNSQSTVDDESCTSSDGGLEGLLSVLARHQKVLVDKLDAVEAAVKSNPSSLSSQNVNAQVEALKCKYFIKYIIFSPLK